MVNKNVNKNGKFNNYVPVLANHKSWKRSLYINNYFNRSIVKLDKFKVK